METVLKHLSRCQHLGWMNVIELKSASIHWLSCGQRAEPYAWSRMLCVLSDARLLLLDDLEVHPSLLSRRAESCTVWLLRYRLRVTPAPSDSAHKERLERRSRPLSGAASDTPAVKATAFLSGRLKRSIGRRVGVGDASRGR
ncbi:uncharacterized protein LOC144049224 isoform X2 [Vanacampus margaritifer]